MGESRPDSYFLQDKELYVLLMLLGVEQFYGLQTTVELSEKTVSETLFSLTKKEYLIPTEGGFHMKEHLRGILVNMVQAQRIITANKEKDNSICIYLGEHVISLEEKWGLSDSFRIGIQEDWMQILSAKGFLLDELMADDLLYDTEEAQPDSEWRREEWTSQIIVLHKDGSIITENRLYKRPLDDLILVTRGLEEQCYHYSERLVRELIEKEM